LLTLLKKALAKIFIKKDIFLPNKHFLVNYCGGKIYLTLKGSMMTKGVIGVYEYWKTKLFFDLVKEGMTCIDAGAHKGYFSLLFAKLMNDKGKVLSFEPLPENCFWFRQSTQVNNYKCIKLYPYALSDDEGTATFYPGKTTGQGSLFSDHKTSTNQKQLTVKTRKLDNILKDEGIEDVDIIKIDVEGAELLVLRGAENILKKSKNVKLFIDIDVKDKETKEKIFEFLNVRGFKMYKIGKNLEPIKRVDKISKNIYGLSIYATKEKIIY
jgi:FkbM family methyltransferase